MRGPGVFRKQQASRIKKLIDYLAYSLILGQAHVLMLHQVQGHIRLDRTWTTTLDRSVLRPLSTMWPIVRNKRRAYVYQFGTFFQALQPYQRPYVY